MQEAPIDHGSPFRQLQASIGSLMFCWCRLENHLAETLRAPADRQPQSFADRFEKLKSRLAPKLASNTDLSHEWASLVSRVDAVRKKRNLIVHGLAGFDGARRDGEPHIICRERGPGHPELVTITLTEVMALCESIARCESDLHRLNHLITSLRSPSV